MSITDSGLLPFAAHFTSPAGRSERRLPGGGGDDGQTGRQAAMTVSPVIDS
jgi:hypothetical protein